MKKKGFVLLVFMILFFGNITCAAPIVVNHTTVNLNQIPQSALTTAKNILHIAYQHTSHGSQITDGMTGLTSFSSAPYGGSFYSWNDGGSGGALDLDDYAMSGDLGNPDRTTWAGVTETYLTANPDVNVVMWSWCGQVSSATEADINTYLTLMNQLELNHPNVKFVYMTGHLDGSGETGNLYLRNEQIRNYCRLNNKILYDFADIESYDPFGAYYLNKGADDGCNYVVNGISKNWAVEWQNTHSQGTDWYTCGSAHTQPLNANRKAYAAWWLFARLSGWTGPSSPDQKNFGIFRNGMWLLDYDGNYGWSGAGSSATTDRIGGLGQGGDTPVTGDWNGDGIEEAGIFRNGMWLLDYNGNYGWSGAGSSATTDRMGWLGQSGDIPIIGDWNGDTKKEIGIFRNGMWLLDYNGNYGWSGAGLSSITDRMGWLGQQGDTPVIGDWNTDGKDEVGLFRNGMWLLDYNGNYGWSGAGLSSITDRMGGLGQSGDTPLVGDWNADKKKEIGIFRNGMWLLDYDGNYGWSGAGSSAITDRMGGLGQSGDKSIIGDWNADGIEEIGIFRNGMWLLDYNGNYGWSGAGSSATTDRMGGLGQSGDTPLIGNWDGVGISSFESISTEIPRQSGGFQTPDINIPSVPGVQVPRVQSSAVSRPNVPGGVPKSPLSGGSQFGSEIKIP